MMRQRCGEAYAYRCWCCSQVWANNSRLELVNSTEIRYQVSPSVVTVLYENAHLRVQASNNITAAHVCGHRCCSPTSHPATPSLPKSRPR
jgi:hypothetical protein